MPTEDNAFVRAASALARVEEVAVASRVVTDAVEAAAASVESAANELQRHSHAFASEAERVLREIQGVRSDVLSARSEINSAVERMRESEEQVLAEVRLQTEQIKSSAERRARTMRRAIWIAVIVSGVAAIAGTAALMLQLGWIAVR
jgi:hypothetical protein